MRGLRQICLIKRQFIQIMNRIIFNFFQKSWDHFWRKHLSKLLLDRSWIFKSRFEHSNFVRLPCFSKLRLINLRKLNHLIIFFLLFYRSSFWLNVSFLFVLVISSHLVKVMFEDFDVVVWATADEEWQAGFHVLVLKFDHAVDSVTAFWKMGVEDFGLFLVGLELI